MQLALAQYLFSFESYTDTDLSKEPRTAENEYFITVNLRCSMT